MYPELVKFPEEDMKVIKIAAGDQHSAAISDGKELYSIVFFLYFLYILTFFS